MLVRDCLGNVASGPIKFKYTLTILHVCRSGDVEKMIEVLNEMMQECCLPDEVICSDIISGMCKYGTPEGARKVFTNLRERKLLREASTILVVRCFRIEIVSAIARLSYAVCSANSGMNNYPTLEGTRKVITNLRLRGCKLKKISVLS
ncbi:hypothetical protein QYF36_009891 [Acer negundo]|nr:hypothetical protein QYF36_009891 [Acer negundo]